MKGLRALFHVSGASLSLALSAATALLLALLTGMAVWASMDGSLAQSLRWAAPLLPSGQSLQTSEVSGSLKSGGRIAHLVWKRADLTLEARDVLLQWDWRAALRGELLLRQLQAAVLRVEDRSAPSTSAFAEIALPLRLDATFAIDRLELQGARALQLEAVAGHYRFDGNNHVLQQGVLRMASGRYQLDGQLQARMPGALRLNATGAVEAPIKLQQRPVLLDATAQLSGTLYGEDAALDLELALQPQSGAQRGPLGAMQAALQAHLRPAAAQPIERARGQWSALDLATLWPQAPQTRLSGKLQVQPDADGWKADMQLSNALEGPLNQNRLPLQSAAASGFYRQGQWWVEKLQAAVAGGTLQAKGESGAGSAAWSLSAQLKGVQPVRMDTRWQSPAWDGAGVARQTPQGITFDAQLYAAANTAGNLNGSRLQAKGLWNEPLLVLDKLQWQTPVAQVDGQLQLDTRSYALRGQLDARLPGATLQFTGSAEKAQGQGSMQGQVDDVAVLQRWLAAFPLLGSPLQGVDAKGDLHLWAQWSGGWQNQGAGLQLDARANSKQLAIQGWRLSDLNLKSTGTPNALALDLRGTWQMAAARVALELQSQLGPISGTQGQARINSLQARISDGVQPKGWTAQLQKPVGLGWQRSALLQSVRIEAGTLALSGPAPGSAALQWEPVSLSQGSGVGAATRWASRGSLQGVPLAWLEALGPTRLADIGLKGDLMMGGQWDASGGDALKLRARLQRSSGDLQLLSPDASGAAVPAGLRDAHVDLAVEREALTAQVVWASDAGGNLQADFASRLGTAPGGPLWAPNAPLQGTIKANLPRVGVWSAFAPVGWRVSGTLDADAALSGTRDLPMWKGTLVARDMAIRSVVDGIDFSNGVMRLNLDGQRMEIAEFRVQGAGGAAGGQVLASGIVDWLPGSAGGPWINRLRMEIEAQAQAFRVTARPDQRLTVSGKLKAQLRDARLTLRGALVADQALIVLPDDTAPKLGADVTVRRGKQAAPVTAAQAQPPPRLLSTVVPDLLVTLDPGSNFQLQGQGINTRLEGLLTLKTQGQDPTPRLTGELRTVNGTYRAYGQRLNIEEGILRFTGVFDNPALDIRAVRPNLQQIVGVQINGTAQLPVLRLFAEPDLTEMEKLSWLVLGRSSANGGSEAAILQQAALLLFAENSATSRDTIVNRIGLDEVSLGQQATTNLDGTPGSQATVRLGKRLSRDFYVAYERSLAGTLGTLYVFYDLSRRFTLRGESGTTNAVDLIFTTRYD